MITEPVRNAAKQIGLYFLQENLGNYALTEHWLDKLRISKIEVDERGVVIHTSRPGLLIGLRGQTYDALSKFLNSDIRIIEDVDDIYYDLVPRKEEDYDYE